MQRIQWEVESLANVEVWRYCKRCGKKEEFVSSGLFRVNANKKNLDIWLIYRCVHCGNSWNFPIYERVNHGKLQREELHAFHQNDSKLAHHYAMQADRLARCGCSVQPPEYRIRGADIPVDDVVQVTISCVYKLNVRIDKLLRQKMALSSKAFKELLDGGYIQAVDGRNICKSNLGHGVELMIYPQMSAKKKGATISSAQEKTLPQTNYDFASWQRDINLMI